MTASRPVRRTSGVTISRTTSVARTVALATTLAGVLAAVPGGAPTSRAIEPTVASTPNIVYILMDDMRRDDLPWLPTVQQQVERTGTRFANFYAPTALCCPSRASMLRGQYPHNTGILTNAEPDGGYAAFAGLESSSLATWLDPTYATGYVGKYLNGYLGKSQTYVPPGWDDWNGTVRTYNYLGVRTNDNGTVVDESGQNSPRVFARQSVEFVEANAPGTEPFFLHLSLVNPHEGSPHTDGDGGRGGTPFVPLRDRGSYLGPRHARHDGYNEQDVTDKTGPVAELPRLTRTRRDRIAVANQQRRESLASADRAVAQVLAAVRASGEWDDTIVIFTSDNGVMLGEHRIPGKKSQPYEETSHLPLLITGPGVPAGNVWTDPAGTQDIAPTILDIAGAQADIELDGESVLPSGERPDGGVGRAVLLEQAALPVDPENGGAVRFAARRTVADTDFLYRGVVTKAWKLVEWYPSDPARRAWELYDLRADPHELANLYGQEQTAERAAELQRRLDLLWMCAGAAQCNQ